MSTLKEIHESQGGKFGYKVRHTIWNDDIYFRPIGYDEIENVFVGLDEGGLPEVFSASADNEFTLFEEPLEIWVNIYKPAPGSYEMVAHKKKESADQAVFPPDQFIRTAKFREVIDE